MHVDQPQISKDQLRAFTSSIREMFGQRLSQHVHPTTTDRTYLVRHTGPNYAQRRSYALANRTRDRLRHLSPTQLPPTSNRPYRKAGR